MEKGAELPGMYVKAFMDGNEEIESLQERITGRYLCENIVDKDSNILVKANHMVTPKRAELIMKKGVDENGNTLTQVKIRTILTCKSHNGVCAKCYGANMATGEPVPPSGRPHGIGAPKTPAHAPHGRQPPPACAGGGIFPARNWTVSGNYC